MNAYTISRAMLKHAVGFLFRPRYYGRENVPNPPFIVTSNHSSNIDPPLVGVACEKYDIDFMAKQEMFDAPVFGVWTRSINGIPVDRKGNTLGALKEALRRLRAGRVVGIFPEGTRSEDGQIKEAKRGIGFLIAKAAVPVLPCYIEGAAEALPKKGGIRPGQEINVYVGEPIDPVEFNELTAQGAYEKIASMVMDRIKQIKKDPVDR